MNLKIEQQKVINPKNREKKGHSSRGTETRREYQAVQQLH